MVWGERQCPRETLQTTHRPSARGKTHIIMGFLFLNCVSSDCALLCQNIFFLSQSFESDENFSKMFLPDFICLFFPKHYMKNFLCFVNCIMQPKQAVLIQDPLLILENYVTENFRKLLLLKTVGNFFTYKHMRSSKSRFD